MITRTLAIDDEASGARRHGREVNRGARGFPEHHIAAAGFGTGDGVALPCPDNKIGEPVAIDVPRTRHAVTAMIIGTLSVDDEPARARRHCRQVDRCGPGLPEHHIAAPRIAASGRVAVPCPDDEIGESIAVHIPGACHADAACIARALSIDDEAASARRHRRQVDRGGSGSAEHHIALARRGASGCGAVAGPDDKVGKAITVDIAGTRHAAAAMIVGTLAIDHEAAYARRHR